MKKRAFAGFWWRVLAWLIDQVVVFSVGFAITLGVLLMVPPGDLPSITVPAPELLGLTARDGAAATLAIRVDLLVGPVLFFMGWAYFALMESSPAQGTIGKIAVGMFVTDMHGDPISFPRASARWWCKSLSSLIFGLGWLMPAFTPRKQALHDFLVRTVVLRNVSAPAEGPAAAAEPGEYWDGRRWLPAAAAMEKR